MEMKNNKDTHEHSNSSDMMHENHSKHAEHNKHEHDEHAEHDHSSPVEDEEISMWKKKLFWAWLFGVPVLILMFIARVFGIEVVSDTFVIIFFLILGFPVVFVFGWSTIKGGFRGLFTFYF